MMLMWKRYKQLPGVEIGEEGKITVNGKVKLIFLVNGKAFLWQKMEKLQLKIYLPR